MEQSSKPPPRRPIGAMNSFATNFFHLRNPYTTAWWSMTYPGFIWLSVSAVRSSVSNGNSSRISPASLPGA